MNASDFIRRNWLEAMAAEPNLASKLVADLVLEALVHGSGAIHIAKDSDYFMVATQNDWLNVIGIEKYFNEIASFPSRGVNAILTGPILLEASKELGYCSNGNMRTLKGEVNFSMSSHSELFPYPFVLVFSVQPIPADVN